MSVAEFYEAMGDYWITATMMLVFTPIGMMVVLIFAFVWIDDWLAERRGDDDLNTP